MKNAPFVRDDSLVRDAASLTGQYRYVWVTDAHNRVLGWLSHCDPGDPGETAARSMTRMDLSSSAVMTDSTLREALSRLIQQGIRSAPVVDNGGKLLGEIRLLDILEA
jgi:Mg/Co/Ni transporter MgtE